MRRDQGIKHIPCIMNSRRLGGAWEFVKTQVDRAEALSHTLTAAQCGGDDNSAMSCRGQLTRLAAGANLRFAYLRVVPWAFVHADTVLGAIEVLNQVRARPLEDHDAFTRRVMNMMGGDIETRSLGATFRGSCATWRRDSGIVHWTSRAGKVSGFIFGASVTSGNLIEIIYMCLGVYVFGE